MKNVLLSLVLLFMSLPVIAQNHYVASETPIELPTKDAIARFIVYGSDSKENPAAEVVNSYMSQVVAIAETPEESDARVNAIIVSRELWLAKYDKKYRAAKKAIENSTSVNEALLNAPKTIAFDFVVESLDSMMISSSISRTKLSYDMLFDDLEIYL